MQFTFKRILKYTLSFLIGLALVYWVFKGVDLQSILDRISEVNYFWVFLSMFIGLLSHYLRAVRWNQLIEPLAEVPKLHSTTYPAVLSMYFVNLIVPRGGEVFRCGAIKRTDQIPMSISFGTVVAERFFDFIILAVFILIMLAIELDKFNFLYESLFSEKLSSENLIKLFFLGIGVLLIGVLFFILFWKKIKKSLLFSKIREFTIQLLKGLTSYKSVKNKPLFWFSTIFIWIGYFFMSYIVIFSVPETANLSIGVGFVLLVLGGVAMATPVQGGIGAYHILVSQGLALYGLSKESGLFFATLLHGSQFISLLIAGALSFIYLVIFRFNKTK